MIITDVWGAYLSQQDETVLFLAKTSQLRPAQRGEAPCPPFDASAESLIQGLKDGSPEAGEEFVVLYTPVLKTWVRGELHRRRMPADRWFDAPSDVVQDVWARFFRHHYQRRPWDSVRHLTAFMQGMAENVIGELLLQHRNCQKRAGLGTQTLEEALAAGEITIRRVLGRLEAVAGPTPG